MQKGKEMMVKAHMLCLLNKGNLLKKTTDTQIIERIELQKTLKKKHSHELKHNADIEMIVAYVFGELDTYFNVSLLFYFVVTKLFSPLSTCGGELRHFGNL